MNITGLIVEYNPFHNGHLHHIEQARIKSNADVLIVVMSGDFLQRGEPAIVDKFCRAKMAVDHGVDLVIELPVVYAVQHSDLFAKASVSLLNEYSVDTIIFGSESGDIKEFEHLQRIKKEDQNFQHSLNAFLVEGFSYPKAYQLATEKQHPSLSIDLSKPNNILGFSYMSAVSEVNPTIKIDTIKRLQADYHQEYMSTPITSATSIRRHLLEKNQDLNTIEQSIPEATRDYLTDYVHLSEHFHQWEDYFPFLKYRLLSDSLANLRRIHGMTEGIEHRLKKQIKHADNFEQFIASVKTKRYTRTRLQRLFIHILLQLEHQEVKKALDALPHLSEARLLGYSSQGQHYLNEQKNRSTIKTITQLKKKMSPILEIDERASRLYYLPLDDSIQSQLFKQQFRPPYRKGSKSD
ncbi:Predicted nucleotidyltransferase [Pelagirhabdus alkalitolerans]|uniref:tRNA(Met) cytidine acetate ligase n=1 Tax=Pelagirhabdus alkalitolerans TaxID=1612202 RepID=A0A1G6H0I5_9BACI|nr:nucleotidyltransferase [Pelagirhabdus alkalitolerans]SDB87445.1 Predicted nucleotidyltransferase [Pelagirhabdus alkalitolerans]